MSHATDAAIGMMDGAYFTSRNDLLNFFNSLLDLNLTKIEQTASGAVACQLTEYIFPGSVPMSRVNWGAKASHEYVANYKLLQHAFNKNKIQKYVDVDKLIRAKYQDNLEFCQWLKAFFDQTAPMMREGRDGYDPVAVRAKGKGGKALAWSKGGAKKASASARPGASSSSSSSRTTGRTTRQAVRSTSSVSGANSRPTSGSSASSKENTAKSRLPADAGQSRKPSATSSTAALSAKVAQLEEQNRSLQLQHASLTCKHSELEHTSAEAEMTLQNVESERDFYFEKLRGVEVMLQVYKEKEEEQEGSGDISRVMDRIFKVMYATIDDDVVVDDDGNLVGALGEVTKAQEDLVQAEEEDEELLTSDIEDNESHSNAPKQFANDMSDLDDALNEAVDTGPKSNESDTNQRFAVIHDDDSSDEDLLAD